MIPPDAVPAAAATPGMAVPDSVPSAVVTPLKSEIPPETIFRIGERTVPKIKKNANATSPNKFQPISSSDAAFDAAGVLARLPKAPKGAPQYALTRRVGDRFEVVSYLETENGVSLEPYVGRNIGVKGTLGTIQIGEKAQKLTTVQTVFERD
jgi:hypothetical protein